MMKIAGDAENMGAGRDIRGFRLWLRSGDVVEMGGAARLAWHGVDRAGSI